jgi:hypothetical protein
MRALVSWEDAEGVTHRFQIGYDPDDAEARLFLEGKCLSCNRTSRVS